MKRIRIKSTGLSIVTSVVAGLGIFGWFQSNNENLKNLSATLFFSSAATGLVANYKSWTDEQDVNDRIQQLVEKYERDLKDINNQLVIQVENHRETTNSAQSLAQQLGLITVQAKALQADYDSLKDELVLANRKVEVKNKELVEVRQATDSRFQQLIEVFLKRVVAGLYDLIETEYTRLDNSCIELLKNENYEPIHPELQAFQINLGSEHDAHIGLVSLLADLDYTEIETYQDASEKAKEVMDIYWQVVDEVCSLRIRFKNLRNTHKFRELIDYKESEKYLMPKAEHIKGIRELSAHDKGIVDGLKEQVNSQGDEISTLAQALLKDLEKANEVAGKLQQQVDELSQPIMWKFAINHATKAGNIIIQYARSLKIHLDRSHYTGDVYSADLFFFTDRINASQTIDIKALNEEGEKIAQVANLREPVAFSYDYDTRLVIAHIVMQYRESEKKVDPVTKVKQFVKPPEALIPFIRDSYHVGLWAATGGGKTTAIANIIGGMIAELRETGTTPTIRLTIPKIDADTQKIFPEVHWLGIPESVFGLLEAALEIQYRIYKSEQAFRAKEIIQDYDPILFFIDEINLIFTRWRSISDNDLESVLDRFEATLTGERLQYFQDFMRIELTNYKNQFASKLLLFIWQTGRSLRVKSLIAGQNLQPGKFGLYASDLDNCAYMSFGDSIKGCTKYKVREIDKDTITQQYDILQKALETDYNLKYTALYCPTVGKSYFGTLPAPNYYQWSANLLQPTNTNSVSIENSLTETQTQTWQSLDGLDNVDVISTPSLDRKAESVHTPAQVDSKQYKTFSRFERVSNLPEKYQNMGYEGYLQLWLSLPKKVDGTVHKTQAYANVFKAHRSDERKLFSEFIDWLEANFK